MLTARGYDSVLPSPNLIDPFFPMERKASDLERIEGPRGPSPGDDCSGGVVFRGIPFPVRVSADPVPVPPGTVRPGNSSSPGQGWKPRKKFEPEQWILFFMIPNIVYTCLTQSVAGHGQDLACCSSGSLSPSPPGLTLLKETITGGLTALSLNGFEFHLPRCPCGGFQSRLARDHSI